MFVKVLMFVLKALIAWNFIMPLISFGEVLIEVWESNEDEFKRVYKKSFNYALKSNMMFFDKFVERLKGN